MKRHISPFKLSSEFQMTQIVLLKNTESMDLLNLLIKAADLDLLPQS